jgi:formamidopyrimidine-DNA glycosylase
MPEAPECRLFAEYLAKVATEKSITDIEIISGRYVKKPFAGFNEIKARLPLKIKGAGCHGKFIYCIFEDISFLQSALGMTGSWTSKPTKHARIKFSLSDGTCLFFNDIRNFGSIKWTKESYVLKAKLKKLGPDLMTAKTAQTFVERAKKKSYYNICKAMMNQDIVAGIGNYIKCEALYECGINPNCRVCDLTEEDLTRLFLAAQEIAWTSYKSFGASIKDYYSPEGESGKYVNFFKVYGKSKDTEGSTIERFTSEDGRTTHWVPEKQNYPL